jgi:hypothetical protein
VKKSKNPLKKTGKATAAVLRNEHVDKDNRRPLWGADTDH